MDIWVSQHFGNDLGRDYLTMAGTDLVDQILSGGRGLSSEYREAISQAIELGKDKRFFHWDLEFPEAFVDLNRGTWKPGPDQGFDAVVGNPPYDEVSEFYSGNTKAEAALLYKCTQLSRY